MPILRSLRRQHALKQESDGETQTLSDHAFHVLKKIPDQFTKQ